MVQQISLSEILGLWSKLEPDICKRNGDRYVVTVNGVCYQVRPEDSNGWWFMDMAVASAAMSHNLQIHHQSIVFDKTAIATSQSIPQNIYSSVQKCNADAYLKFLARANDYHGAGI